MSFPQTITPTQANKETPIVEMFDALKWASTYSLDALNTSALARGYNGGRWGGFVVADVTHTFGASTTTYVSVALVDGALNFSTSSTNYNDDTNYAKVETVVTGASAVTSVTDDRGGPGGVHGGGGAASGGDMVLASVQTVTGAKTFGVAGAVGKLKIAGTTSGAATLDAPAVAGTAVITLPGVTSTLATLAGTETLTNKTLTNAIVGTQTPSDNSTKAASTAYVDAAVGAVGGGTVTHAGGALTSNAVVLGAGTADTKVVTGITTDGTSALNLGAAGSSVGKVVLANATSGTITMQPPTGALGTVTVTIPAATDTLVGKATTDTLTNKTLTSPTLTTPVLGTPASGNLSSCTADGTNAVGFRHIPPNSQSAAYTAVLTDGGKSIDHPSTDANARTFTIPANASVAYPDGTTISFSNMTSQSVTIAITSDTLYFAGTGTTGSRSLAQYGTATARKLTSTTWLISGVGLT